MVLNYLLVGCPWNMVVLFSVSSRNAPHTKLIKQQIRGKGLFVCYFPEVGGGASFCWCCLFCNALSYFLSFLSCIIYFCYVGQQEENDFTKWILLHTATSEDLNTVPMPLAFAACYLRKLKCLFPTFAPTVITDKSQFWMQNYLIHTLHKSHCTTTLQKIKLLLCLISKFNITLNT